MDPQIEYFLARVARRYRRQSWAWVLTATWLGACFAIAAGWVSFPELRSGRWRDITIPWIALALGGMASWVALRFAYRDLRGIAQRVERAFPSLEQRLLTLSSASTHSSPYFRRRLAQDVVRHARAYDWDLTVGRLGYWTAWIAQWLALAGLITLVATGWGRPGHDSTLWDASQGLAADGQTWLVEPGDVEIERGSDLFITLKLPTLESDGASVDARVILEKTDDSQVLAMSQSLGGAIYGTAVRRIEDSFTYRVQAMGRESPAYHANVFEYPALVRCDARIEPPAYSQQPSKSIDDTRRVTLPQGAGLTWICTLNKSVAHAELIDENDVATTLEADPDAPHVVRATFTMERSQRWRVRLVDSDGRREKVEELLSARVIENQPATIQVQRPGDLRVSALQELDVSAKLSDDFGIRRAGISLALSGQEPRDEILLDTNGIASMPQKQEVSHRISMEDLNAQVDQLLSYSFWIEDLDRNGQPRRIDGDMFFAEVRPFEEFFRQGDNSSQPQRQAQQNQESPSAGMAEELAELQKKIITGTWNTIRDDASKSAEQRQSALDTLIESQQQARSQTDELSQTLRSPDSAVMLEQVQRSMESATEMLEQSKEDTSTDSLRQAMQKERAAYEGLLRLRSREFEISQSQQSQSARSSQSARQRNRQQQIEQLQLDNDQNRYETESRPEALDENTQREMRQVMNRLDELARRQQDLNEQLRELDLALQEADTDQKRQELEEQLRRLRDSQQELLQDADELLDRMNRESNQQSMQESRQQMEQAREQLQQSSQAMQQQQPSSALASGSRAQETMEQTRDTLRQQSAQGLQQDMRELVERADALDRQQQQLQQRMPGRPASDEAGPRPSNTAEPPTPNSVLRPDPQNGSDDTLSQQWQDQRRAFEELLENIKQTVTESETSEPVLAEELYETYRDAQRESIGEKLKQTSQLLQRGLDEPARSVADQAGEGIRKLREQLEQSSESVLGSERESLNRALRELDRARGALHSEPQTENAQDTDAPSAATRAENAQPSQTQPSDNPPPGESTAGEQRSGAAESSERARGSQADPSDPGDERAETRSANGNLAGGLRAMESALSPLVGEEYSTWTDSLREVEELVRDPELKAEAARIREAAREMRIEYKRHATVPQWPLVQRLIAEPMDQLRRNIAQELLRKTAEKNQIVPLDRDPVPHQFQRAVDRYFERLGSESPAP